MVPARALGSHRWAGWKLEHPETTTVTRWGEAATLSMLNPMKSPLNPNRFMLNPITLW
jgi:hypothetical protein